MIAVRRRVAELPPALWVLLHVVVYLVVMSAGIALWDSAERGSDLTRSLGMVLVSIAWSLPLVIGAGIAASMCLGVLTFLGEARRHWFRLAAVLLFAGPLPLFLLTVGSPADALVVALIQTATALVIVQPRHYPSGWAGRDPAPQDHG